MIDKTVKLNLDNRAFPPSIHASQYDDMWAWHFQLFCNGTRWTIPSGASIVLNGRKPDGNVFGFAGTVASNEAVVNCDVQMTAVAGPVLCELSVLSDGKVVSSANFRLEVERAPKAEGDISSETTLPAYAELLAIGARVPADIPVYITDWLEANISQETGYVLDRSLSSSAAAAPADLVGDLKSQVGALYNVPYTPSNMSTDSNGLIYLEKGYIKIADGGSGTSSTGKYYRTQTGASGTGSRSFLLIGNQTVIVTLGLDWVQWNCWSYSGDTYGTASHANTSGYISGLDDIYIPANSTDVRFAMSFRKTGESDADRTAFTEEELIQLKNAIKFVVSTDTNLDITGSPADAKATAGRLTRIWQGISDYASMQFLNVPSPNNNENWEINPGGVVVTTGQSTTEKIYCRLITASGEIYPLIYSDVILDLGLDQYYWTAWTYSGNTWATANRSLTDNALIRADRPIRIVAGDDDRYFCVSFRRVDSAEITADDITAISNAFRVLRWSSGREDRILYLGDSIARGRLGGQSANARYPIPTRLAEYLGIQCENFGIGEIGWISGWAQGRTNKTNAIGYLKRVGDPAYYSFRDAYNGYKFIGRGSWDDFNTIAFALGTNDLHYPIGSLDDIDDSLSYAQVMAWKTSAQDSDSTNRTIVKAMYQAVRWIRESEDNHSDGEPYVPNGKYKRMIIIDFTTGSRTDFRRSVCDLYNAFCTKYGLTHITTSGVPIDPLHIADYLPDGVHPNEETYALISRYLAAKM